MMQPTTRFKFSHALTGPYLPLPGSPPGWPFAGIGGREQCPVLQPAAGPDLGAAGFVA